MAGRFVTLEGGEGAGKSTQARRLAATLRAGGHAVLLTREPGGTPGAERLREVLLHGPENFVPEAETLLHFAARAEHIARAIRPALAAGQWVVCDRFADSTMAYQGYGGGVDRTMIAALTAMVGTLPDLTLVLDVTEPVATARRVARAGGADRYEALDAAFHARVRAGFRAIAAAAPSRCALIDADGAEDAVATAIAATIRARWADAFG
ncbi:MAG: dTMP kinase [Rhodospirillales bacterium]|nr:dTMP kinase [Rhodospirillales bacterium]